MTKKLNSETHEPMNRRRFFRGAASFSVGGLGAGALLAPLQPNVARGADSQAPAPTAQLNEQTRRALRWAGPAPAQITTWSSWAAVSLALALRMACSEKASVASM